MNQALFGKMIPASDKESLIFEVSPVPPADWNGFVSKYSGCVYHDTAWIQTLETGYQSKTLYFYGRDRSETLRIGIAGTVFHFLFFRVFFSLVPYGGIIGEQNFMAELQIFFEKQLLKRGIHQIRITQIARYFFPSLPGYRQQSAFQHVLDLEGQTPESLWEEYRKNNRRDINKALRSGIKIKEAESETDLKAYYDLYNETMKRNHSLRFYPRALYEDIYRTWIAKGKASILFAEYDGRKIAGNLLVHGSDTTYLLGSVSSNIYLKLCPNDLLIHEAILRTLKAGRRYFDFMMSSYGDADLIRFKEKWGARAYPFCILEKDLAKFQTALWRFIWKLSNSRLGSKFIFYFDNLKSWLVSR